MRLTDRFYLGEPQMRGFGIRGVGPRVVRQYYSADSTTGAYTVTSTRTDDALGGRFYYQGRAELEIPLGSGAKEMGLRPSIFADTGAVWSIKRPALSQCTSGCFFGSRDSSGNQLYYPRTGTDSSGNAVYDTTTTTTSATGANGANQAIGSTQYFSETYLGDSWKPRLAVGIGVNWNSPFGPFRIDFSKVILKEPGDDPKTFTFNVGTQF